MSTNKSLFIREYQRKSKSPWDDHCTVLLLADYQVNTEETMELNFGQYIYQHRDSAGRILGISVSKSILEDFPEFTNQYLEGIDMYIILLLLKEEIRTFCNLFKQEFLGIYGLYPNEYFAQAEQHWANRLNDDL
ncbi:hypothetical protein L1D40_13655 [Shewanella insulae]|uniref:hypothetical protein n=1 Tax=Shewanella insulae TaxID=2681496 RepID=UPI001EFDA551|nr:hypothetical protein [Shewanella insulae]MCG9714838.1 hypothetical protein [Shewanella insulae]MCG9756257.1 hypothetical protein [Shewanella insulae]